MQWYSHGWDLSGWRPYVSKIFNWFADEQYCTVQVYLKLVINKLINKKNYRMDTYNDGKKAWLESKLPYSYFHVVFCQYSITCVKINIIYDNFCYSVIHFFSFRHDHIPFSSRKSNFSLINFLSDHNMLSELSLVSCLYQRWQYNFRKYFNSIVSGLNLNTT